ncbi:hypothetical protein [Nocardia sp. NPDC052566]|uniref:hypothetical protein n=1 Tax=Nocardia sp. NPDC052566 TaxID=3364330 RepID=UPI0037C7C223
MVSPLRSEIAEKVDRLRSLLPERGESDFFAIFPPGADLDSDGIIADYCQYMNFLIDSDEVSIAVRPGLDDLRLPDAMVELYRITSHPDADVIELFSQFDKGEIMDSGGEVHRSEEHWLTIGLIGNDRLLVSLVTGEVMFSDQYFWRYGEEDSSRVVAPDMLTFFNECMIGARYAEFVHPDELENPAGWYRFLRDNRFFS